MFFLLMRIYAVTPPAKTTAPTTMRTMAHTGMPPSVLSAGLGRVVIDCTGALLFAGAEEEAGGAELSAWLCSGWEAGGAEDSGAGGSDDSGGAGSSPAGVP